MEQRFRLVKTDKVMAGKALKSVGINVILIMMSRRVLNMPVRVCDKGIFDCQIWAFHNATYIELRRTIE